MRKDRETGLPIFSGSELQKVQQAIDWYYAHTDPVKVSPEQFEREFFSRSPEQILRERHVDYQAPCPSFTGLVGQVLLKSGLEPKIVVEKHLNEKGKKVVHFFLEIEIGGKLMCMDAGRNGIFLENANPTKKKERKVIARKKVTAEMFRQPVVAVLGIKSAKDLERFPEAKSLFKRWKYGHRKRVPKALKLRRLVRRFLTRTILRPKPR